MNKLEYGAKQAVRNCVCVKPDEKVVLITDLETQFIADEILKECEAISPNNTQVFIMEDFGVRPEDGSHPLEFPSVMGDALKKADVSFYCAAGKKGELASFRLPMTAIVNANKKLRHAHMPNISRLLMETGMNVDYSEVQALTKRVHDIVRGAKEIRVTTPAGTDFTVYLNPDWPWIVCDALIQPGNWSNLPDGEIFTCAQSVPKGHIVIDGILGDFFCEAYGPLDKTPLIVDIEDSRITQVHCENKKLLEEFERYIAQDENANRVGEFAIGTNIGLERLVANLLQDEKFPGIHVAFGHGYPEKTGSGWNSQAHVDAVLLNCTVTVDGKTIMKDSQFLI